MSRVTGIGGVFFRSRDPKALAEWYGEHLGIPLTPHGSWDFRWRDAEVPERPGRTVWSPFPKDTEYFGPQAVAFMINYRVDDLDGLLAELRDRGLAVDDRIEEYEYGRFAWITDPEGNRIELWEPAEAADPE